MQPDKALRQARNQRLGIGIGRNQHLGCPYLAAAGHRDPPASVIAPQARHPLVENNTNALIYGKSRQLEDEGKRIDRTSPPVQPAALVTFGPGQQRDFCLIEQGDVGAMRPPLPVALGSRCHCRLGMSRLDPACATVGHSKFLVRDQVEDRIGGAGRKLCQSGTLFRPEHRDQRFRVKLQTRDHLPAIQAGGTLAQAGRFDHLNR